MHPLHRLSYCLILILASCSQTCPPASAVRAWSLEEEQQVAKEIRTLPANSTTAAFLEDYARMRREAE